MELLRTRLICLRFFVVVEKHKSYRIILKWQDKVIFSKTVQKLRTENFYIEQKFGFFIKKIIDAPEICLGGRKHQKITEFLKKLTYPMM